MDRPAWGARGTRLLMGFGGFAGSRSAGRVKERRACVSRCVYRRAAGEGGGVRSLSSLPVGAGKCGAWRACVSRCHSNLIKIVVSLACYFYI
jgi:hypothetical protein